MDKRKDIEAVWERIKCHEGETFFTIRKLEFFYRMRTENSFSLSRGGQSVSKDKIESILGDVPIKNPSDLNVYAQSYIFGILSDERIRSGLW